LARKAIKAAGIALMLSALNNSAFAGAGPPPAVPEIDPDAALSAMALLTGGIMVLTGRRRTK
jgi:hypothetical protein